MSDSPFSKYGLFLMSAVLLVIALGTWSIRGQRLAETVGVNKNEEEEMQYRQRAQRAVALLFRAFHADNHLTYSAVSDTMANYGGHKMEASARITRAPENMAIEYTDGPQKGLRSGFNGRWHWRQQRPDARIEAYAEMQRNTADIAAKRFALMLENYDVEWKGRSEIKGRPVEIVELRPFHPSPGAHGPCKTVAIDIEKGLTLRVETFDHRKQRVMSTTLRDVDYAPKVSFISTDEIIQVAQKKPWTIQDLGDNSAKVAHLTGLQPPKPAYLPQGFRFDTVGVHHCNYKNAPYQAALARYTDGVNTLTVFAMQSGTTAGLASCPPDAASPDAAGQPVKDKTPLVQTVAAKSASGAVSPSGKGQSCDFGAGSLVMRDTPQGRLIAVGDLPSPVLHRVLESASIVPVAGSPKTSSPAPSE